jgi:long-chain acyl-CoA synthetase
LYNALLARDDVRAGRADFHSMKTCVSGAAPLHAETRRRFESVTGGRLIEGYSMTEAIVASTAEPIRGKSKPGSVGLPWPDVEVKIVDAASGGRELPDGDVGEILIRGPQIMPGYWNAPEETAAALRDRGDGGARWLYTGDLGYLDDDGFLFVVDRKKELIKTSGLQVWPREIEEALLQHPAVAEVGVAGVPGRAKGEVPKAWVVLRTGAAVTEGELREFCRARLAPFKTPARIEFRRELPKSMAGKVLRRVLVQEEAAAVGT